jgi:hypothetical protein
MKRRDRPPGGRANRLRASAKLDVHFPPNTGAGQPLNDVGQGQEGDLAGTAAIGAKRSYMPCMSDWIGRTSAGVFLVDGITGFLIRPSAMAFLLRTCGTQSIDSDTSRNSHFSDLQKIPVNSRSTNLGGHTVGLLTCALRICSFKSARKPRRE